MQCPPPPPLPMLLSPRSCAQSGAARRNGHQRKITQQEESCQNLTDFTPARVPSSLDIFTAYNETLQCSHECVRTPVPVYTEEALHSPGDYKATFNGNRWGDAEPCSRAPWSCLSPSRSWFAGKHGCATPCPCRVSVPSLEQLLSIVDGFGTAFLSSLPPPPARKCFSDPSSRISAVS